MEHKAGKRELGLDLARAAAGVLVLSTHFFLNAGFYQTEVSGGTMFLSCVIRMACMTCVPLFLLLTGYTCVHREWSRGYYWKIVPILLTFVLTGMICGTVRVLFLHEPLPEGLVPLVRMFVRSPYGWYIEMYVGLFLLSPFLNAAWRSLEDKPKKALLISLLVMTALPGLVNQLGQILPDWWVGIYPLTYYVLGAWLREHPLKARGWQLLGGWLMVAVLIGVKGYYTANGGVYFWMPEDEWWSWSLTLQAVLLFSWLVRVKEAPKPVEWLIGRIAGLSLGMYLVSYAVDSLVYPYLKMVEPIAHRRLWWMPVTVLITVTLSCLAARVVEWVRVALSEGFHILLGRKDGE